LLTGKTLYRTLAAPYSANSLGHGSRRNRAQLQKEIRVITRIVVCLSAALALATASGCGAAASRSHQSETIALTGTVEFHQGNVGRGGSADPSGYVLKGQKDYQPLYLRQNKSLNDPAIAKFVHQKVEVSGYPNFYKATSDNPTSSYDQVLDYWVLDVTAIEATRKTAEPPAAKDK
jgi:hypothetical protein